MAVSGSFGVWVLMGLSDGPLAAPQQIPLENGGLLAAVADMNGDGIPDLVLEESLFFSPGLIKDLLGNGDGTLGIQATMSVQGGLLSMEAGDLEGEGVIDLIVNTNSGLTALSGAGDGSFVVQALQATPLLEQEIAVGDVDVDSLDDVVGVAFGPPGVMSELLILKGSGDGSFTQITNLPLRAEVPANPQIVDLDSDSILDLLVDDKQISGVEVLFGQGSGSYDASLSIAEGSNTLTTLIQDRDSDGISDLVFLNGTGADLNIDFGLGSRSFSVNSASRVSRNTPQSGLGHWDTDQTLDFIAINANALLVLRGTGDGGFEEEFLTPLTTSQTPTAFALFHPAVPVSARTPLSMALLDIDRDGALDLVSGVDNGGVSGTSNSLILNLGLGDGSFGTDTEIALTRTPDALVVMNVDSDDFMDLALADTGANVLTTGNLALPRTRSCPSTIFRELLDCHLIIVPASTVIDTHDISPTVSRGGVVHEAWKAVHMSVIDRESSIVLE